MYSVLSSTTPSRLYLVCDAMRCAAVITETVAGTELYRRILTLVCLWDDERWDRVSSFLPLILGLPDLGLFML